MLESLKEKLLTDKLPTKRAVIALFVFASIYFFVITILWTLTHVPKSTPWFLWLPFALWGVVFIFMLVVSLRTQKYANIGNLIFHGAFILFATSALLSYFFRFEGVAQVEEGDAFFGEESEYTTSLKGSEFKRLAPNISFRLDKTDVQYWNGQLFFTKLDGYLTYPMDSLKSNAVIDLTGETYINGARVRIKDFAFFPIVDVKTRSGYFFHDTAKISVYPPGMAEDFMLAGDYQVFMKVLSDPEMGADGTYYNKSVNVTDPVFEVRVEWLNDVIFKGFFREGEELRTRDIYIKFEGLRYWLNVAIVRDPGEIPAAIGFIMLITGGLIRIKSHIGKDRQFLPEI